MRSGKKESFLVGVCVRGEILCRVVWMIGESLGEERITHANAL